MCENPTGFVLKSKHKLKTEHEQQIPDNEMSHKPGKSALVAL